MGPEPDYSSSPHTSPPIIGYAGHNTPSAAQVARDFDRMHRKPITFPTELKAVLGVAAATLLGLVIGAGGKGGGSALVMPVVIAFTGWFVLLRLRTRQRTPALWRGFMFVASIGAIVFTSVAVVQADGLSYFALTTYRPARIAVTLVAVCVALFVFAEIAALFHRCFLRNAAISSPTLPHADTP